MSRLFAFGCSNTYGEGLPDCWADNDAGPTPSMFAWPQLTADALNLECVNLSVPGTSNKQICNDILNTNFKQSDIVVIMWTYFNRTCFFQDDDTSKRIMIQDVVNKGLKRKRQKYNAHYYRTFYTETNSNIENYMYINLSKSILNERGIKNYHITCNKSQPWSQLVPPLPHRLNPPQWNSVELDNINNCFIDVALDKKHPGVKSQAQVSEKVKKYIREEYNDF